MADDRLSKLAANRARKYRARCRGEFPEVPLCSCGSRILGSRLICRQCWLLTPDGREWSRQRDRIRKAAQRAQNKALSEEN
jgi:hypothetical protein